MVFVVLAGFVTATLYELKGIDLLETYKPPIISKIYDINGKVISEFYKERRKIVDLNDISPHIIDATLATEDKRFREHYGVDPTRIFKALLVNLSSLRKEQGGSTITIQLSKLIFLGLEKTFTRKIIEVWYALQIETQYSKEEILNFYFNQINYGHGAYGVEAAANFFFNKTAKEVTIAEAALLAGIPKSPVYYSPIRYPDSAMRRHRVVLLAMVNNGYITEEQSYRVYQNFWQQFSRQVKNQERGYGQDTINHAPYFTEYIRAKLERDFQRDKIYEQGLNIYTTLDLNHQKAAQKYLWEVLEQQNKIGQGREKNLLNFLPFSTISSLSSLAAVFNLKELDLKDSYYEKRLGSQYKEIQEGLKSIAGNFNLNNLLDLSYIDLERDSEINFNNENAQGAVISINPQNGYITSMVGGSPFSFYNQFNRAINIRRQIGSTLKPFIYSIAIDKDIINASTLLNDSPLIFDEYIPKNYDNRYRGEILARDALIKSVNVLAVETLDKIGVAETRKSLFKIFGANSESSQLEKFPKDLTLALGTGSFSPLSLATAYAVLANNGKEVIPKTIRYITDSNGEMLKNYQSDYNNYEEEQLISETTTFIIRNIIKEVFSRGGTAFYPDLLADFKHRETSFGKTGTTSNWHDAWFAGANAYLSTVVWVGYDDNKSLGRGRTGGRVSAPIWIKFEKEVLQNKEPVPFLRPSGVVSKFVCRTSGKLASADCPPHLVYQEFYKDSFSPDEEDDKIAQTKDEEDRFFANFFEDKKESVAENFFNTIKQENQIEDDQQQN